VTDPGAWYLTSLLGNYDPYVNLPEMPVLDRSHKV
jgi:hypothetical protein